MEASNVDHCQQSSNHKINLEHRGKLARQETVCYCTKSTEHFSRICPFKSKLYEKLDGSYPNAYRIPVHLKSTQTPSLQRNHDKGRHTKVLAVEKAANVNVHAE